MKTPSAPNDECDEPKMKFSRSLASPEPSTARSSDLPEGTLCRTMSSSTWFIPKTSLGFC